jgi:hypothetical protein
MSQKDEWIVTIPSTHSVDQTMDRLEIILQSKGVKLFALVDHSGEAAKVGLKMPPTKLLIFGNPKAGTPLMLDAPSIALPSSENSGCARFPGKSVDLLQQPWSYYCPPTFHFWPKMLMSGKSFCRSIFSMIVSRHSGSSTSSSSLIAVKMVLFNWTDVDYSYF